MKHQEAKMTHPVLYAIKTFWERLRQNPEVYPIKHYKRVSRWKRKLA
jgi:hypothetical protein